MPQLYRVVKWYTGPMSPMAIGFLVVMLGVIGGVVTLIVRGIAAGSRVPEETRRLVEARRALGPVEGLEIRALGAEDRPSWERLWDDYCDFYGQKLPPEVSDATWSRILDPASPIQGWGAFVEGRLVGLAHTVLHPHTWSTRTLCYLEDLFVSPSVRGRGVGHSLISFLWDRAAAEGWGRLYWHTEESNATARRLYDRFRPADGYVRYTLTP